MTPVERRPQPTPSQIDAAILQRERTLAAHPGDAKAHYNLALLLIERNRRDDAIRHLNRALAILPAFAPATFALGRLALEANDLAAAAQLLQAAAAAPALTLDARFVLAEVLERLDRKVEAAATLSWVIAQNPPSPAPYANLCHLLMDTAADKAIAVADRGLARFPKFPRLSVMKGAAQLRQGDPEGAMLSLRHALKLDPENPLARGFLLQAARQAANWEAEARAFPAVRQTLRKDARTRQLAIPLHAALNFGFSAAELRLIGEDSAAFHGGRIAPLPPVHAEPAARPLVIGYLSPDYRNHPIAHLVADVFAAHDPARVRAVAFSLGPDDADTVRRDIAIAARPFVDLRGLSDRAAAERIRAEGTDILVDLALYTHHHRPAIAAYRPAPVQAAWLGLPATTGAPWFDYLLVDDIVAPAAHAGRFSETLVHLSCGYQPNRNLGRLEPTPSRVDLGLPEDRVVFGCFNAHLKIDRDSFSVWMAVLSGVPGSVLWLLAPPDAVATRYRAAAEAAGIAPERLVFAAKAARAAHLARLPQADLMLDTLTYGAHTTCSDALRAGVPMLTVLGEQFAARVAASLVTRAGMPELVLPDRDAFVAEAIRLGRDAASRDALRQKVAVAVPASPVFDPDAQARALEDAFEAIWAKRVGA